MKRRRTARARTKEGIWKRFFQYEYDSDGDSRKRPKRSNRPGPNPNPPDPDPKDVPPLQTPRHAPPHPPCLHPATGPNQSPNSSRSPLLRWGLRRQRYEDDVCAGVRLRVVGVLCSVFVSMGDLPTPKTVSITLNG